MTYSSVSEFDICTKMRKELITRIFKHSQLISMGMAIIHVDRIAAP